MLTAAALEPDSTANAELCGVPKRNGVAVPGVQQHYSHSTATGPAETTVTRGKQAEGWRLKNVPHSPVLWSLFTSHMHGCARKGLARGDLGRERSPLGQRLHLSQHLLVIPSCSVPLTGWADCGPPAGTSHPPGWWSKALSFMGPVGVFRKKSVFKCHLGW